MEKRSYIPQDYQGEKGLEGFLRSPRAGETGRRFKKGR